MESILKTVNFLKGKKTYLLAFLMFIASVGAVAGELANVLNGSEDWSTFMNSPSVQILLASPALAFLRVGISKSK